MDREVDSTNLLFIAAIVKLGPWDQVGCLCKENRKNFLCLESFLKFLLQQKCTLIQKKISFGFKTSFSIYTNYVFVINKLNRYWVNIMLNIALKYKSLWVNHVKMF